MITTNDVKKTTYIVDNCFRNITVNSIISFASFIYYHYCSNWVWIVNYAYIYVYRCINWQLQCFFLFLKYGNHKSIQCLLNIHAVLSIFICLTIVFRLIAVFRLRNYTTEWFYYHRKFYALKKWTGMVSFYIDIACSEILSWKSVKFRFFSGHYCLFLKFRTLFFFKRKEKPIRTMPLTPRRLDVNYSMFNIRQVIYFNVYQKCRQNTVINEW